MFRCVCVVGLMPSSGPVFGNESNQCELWVEIKWYKEHRRQLPQLMCLLSRKPSCQGKCASFRKSFVCFHAVFILMAKVVSCFHFNLRTLTLPKLYIVASSPRVDCFYVLGWPRLKWPDMDENTREICQRKRR